MNFSFSQIVQVGRVQTGNEVEGRNPTLYLLNYAVLFFGFID